MAFDYDVVIMGGAFAGAATGIILKRKHPAARVLIIEKTTEFDRKVGESTTEISSCYMTRILGLSHYLAHQHLQKQGLRLWFSNNPGQSFDSCVEIGTRYQSRLQTYQVDRSTLDSHLLESAVKAGCELWRPAKVTKCELEGANGQTINATVTGGERSVRARWVVDATGRATMLARKLGHFHQNTEHPINSVWARFTGVKDWDSYDWRQRFPEYANACRTPRSGSTNHLMGHGWWVWIIPLHGGDVSAGIVYDDRIFKLPEGPSLGERLHAHILSNPVGREIFSSAHIIEGDVHAYSALPYYTDKVCDDGWAIVGDAAGFMDPLYSSGLDLCSYTSYFVADFLAQSLDGKNIGDQLDDYNEQYPRAYRYWFESLYKDKYYYMGDAELMSAGLLVDVGLYYLGLVIPAYRNPEAAFLIFPFQGPIGRVVAAVVTFYNRRLATLGKRRWLTGYHGKHNSGWRELYEGFTPDLRSRKLVRKGILRWCRAELTNLKLILSARARRSTNHSPATSSEAYNI
jgi:flavin-dependent dehydrogenase